MPQPNPQSPKRKKPALSPEQEAVLQEAKRAAKLTARVTLHHYGLGGVEDTLLGAKSWAEGLLRPKPKPKPKSMTKR